MGSAASFFVVDDAIVGLAQPLTEALNHLAGGARRACDVIEELGRREEFYLDLAGGSSRRTAGAIFHNAHLPYKLSRTNRAEKDGVAIEFPEYIDGTPEEAKNTVCRVSLSEEDMLLGEVRAEQRATWLLVYDNVTAPDAVADLLPSAGARVLIKIGRASCRER